MLIFRVNLLFLSSWRITLLRMFHKSASTEESHMTRKEDVQGCDTYKSIENFLMINLSKSENIWEHLLWVDDLDYLKASSFLTPTMYKVLLTPPPPPFAFSL